MSYSAFGRAGHGWRHLMLCAAILLAACTQSPSVLSVSSPLNGEVDKYAVEAGQRIDFEFDLITVTPIQRNRDLHLEFDAELPGEAAGGRVVLEGFFGLVTPPTVRLKDNRIIASGELIAVANAERRDPLEALLENLAPAAGGGSVVSSGIPLFSYLGSSLAERFRSRYPEAVPVAASQAPEGPAEARERAPSLAQLRYTLAIIRASNELAILQDYRQRINELQGQIDLRAESGVATRTDSELIAAWALNAEQKQARFQTALDIALDDFENQLGRRPPAYSVYPMTWDAQMPVKLETLLEALSGSERSAAREYWRLATLGSDNARLQRQLLAMMEKIHASILEQFQIGQRTLSDVLTSEKGLFENAIVSNDTHYRRHLAQAQLYALLDRLPKAEPDQWQASGEAQ